MKQTANTSQVGRMHLFIRLWGYLYQQRFMVVLALFLSISSNVLALLGPFLSGLAIDAIGTQMGKVDFSKVYLYCGLMLIFYILSALLSYWLSALMIQLSQKVVCKMREDAFCALTKLPIQYFDSHQTGDLISRISYDIDVVNASLSNDLLQIATSVITVVGSFGMMLAISPQLLVVFVITIPVAILFTKYRTNKVRPLFRKRSKKLGELNGFAEEILSGQKTTKAYHQEQTMISRFDRKNQEACDAYYRSDYYGSTTGPCVNFINNISLALISMLGAILFLYQQITLGNLSSFVLYSRKFSGPINEIANIIGDLQSACAAAERVFRLIDEQPELADSSNAQPLVQAQGSVRMENVRFGYRPEKIVLKDLNLDVRPGQLIAIVGHTGAGKTTITNLLMRFYELSSGHILMDGKDIQTLTRESVRRSYAIVLQDAWLFQGTIRENLCYGNPNASEEEMVKTAQAARIHDFIVKLPQGYDTLVSEDGINISQGQKQLLTIARALLMDCRMLILDEATSNVDTRTEIKIQQALRELMKNKTCFVIAHRLSTIQNADRILVVEQGNIVEQGTHTQLLQKNGVYAELYHAQFE